MKLNSLVSVWLLGLAASFLSTATIAVIWRLGGMLLLHSPCRPEIYWQALFMQIELGIVGIAGGVASMIACRTLMVFARYQNVSDEDSSSIAVIHKWIAVTTLPAPLLLLSGSLFLLTHICRISPILHFLTNMTVYGDTELLAAAALGSSLASLMSTWLGVRLRLASQSYGIVLMSLLSALLAGCIQFASLAIFDSYNSLTAFLNVLQYMIPLVLIGGCSAIIVFWRYRLLPPLPKLILSKPPNSAVLCSLTEEEEKETLHAKRSENHPDVSAPHILSSVEAENETIELNSEKTLDTLARQSRDKLSSKNPDI